MAAAWVASRRLRLGAVRSHLQAHAAAAAMTAPRPDARGAWRAGPGGRGPGAAPPAQPGASVLGQRSPAQGPRGRRFGNRRVRGAESPTLLGGRGHAQALTARGPPVAGRAGRAAAVRHRAVREVAVPGAGGGTCDHRGPVLRREGWRERRAPVGGLRTPPGHPALAFLPCSEAGRPPRCSSAWLGTH